MTTLNQSESFPPNQMNTTQIKTMVLSALKDETPSREVSLFIKTFFEAIDNKTNPLKLFSSLGSLLQYRGKTLRILKLMASYTPSKEKEILKGVQEIISNRKPRKISPSTKPLRVIIDTYIKYAEPDLAAFAYPTKKILVSSKKKQRFEKTVALSHRFFTDYRPYSTRGTTGTELINSVLEGKPNPSVFNDALGYLLRDGLIDPSFVKQLK